MTILYGYGEDALTLYALSRGLRDFLNQLNDDTTEDKVIVYFRPSFGRRSPTRNATPSVFGEFDAIVISEKASYLVEGKWNSSAELKDRIITVTEGQQRRHKVFRWYYEKWRMNIPPTWADFRLKFKNDFESVFPNLTIPTSKTRLAKNLEFVLRKLFQRDIPLIDVLLFSTIEKEAPPFSVEPSEFKLVIMQVQSVGGDGFIKLMI